MNNLIDTKRICVIDSETNYDDEIISIGALIVDACCFDVIDSLYLIVYPECLKPAMFKDELNIKGVRVDLKDSRSKCLNRLNSFLESYGINDLFAYNAYFDYHHLSELNRYNWFDIMRIAAYKQYNPSLIGHGSFFSTGRLIRGYGVEKVLNILKKKHHIKTSKELHNALEDAKDEALIMKLLELSIDAYGIARIN